MPTTKNISKIRNTEPALVLSGKHLIQQFQKEGIHEIETREIALNSEDVFQRDLNPHKRDLDYFSKIVGEVTAEDVSRIFNQVVDVLQDPYKVAKHLKSLDEEVGREITSLEYQESDLPQYLIPARGFFVAGPPPQGYQLRDQGRLLDKILLKREQANGINREGFTPKFVGFVDPKKANNFVMDGHVFAEDVQVDNLILHSKYGHRLQIEALSQAVKNGEIDLKIASGQKLEMLGLLQMMVTIKQGPVNLWQMMIDNEVDNMTKAGEAGRQKFSITDNARKLNAHEAAYEPENFSYSCRSPGVTNSIVTCFGQEFDLPNLQHVLLNSQWKQAAKMVGRARQIINGEVKESFFERIKADWDSANYAFDTSTWPSLTRKVVNFFKDFGKVAPAVSEDFDNLYTSCMKSLICIGIVGPNLIYKSPLTKSPAQAAASEKYAQYQDGQASFIERFFGLTNIDPAIKKKITEPNTLKKDAYPPRDGLSSIEVYAAEKTPEATPEIKASSRLFFRSKQVQP